MAQSAGNNLNGSDIQRYHSGQMTSEERHALEKAALDDPFLADAIEGYTYTTTPDEDLVSIRSRLDQKNSERKVVPLFTTTWMKVAVIIFVVAGGVWLLLNTQNASNEKIAVEQKLNKENIEDKSSTYKIPDTDSAKSNQTFFDVDKPNKKTTSSEESNKIEKQEPQRVTPGLTLQNTDDNSKNRNSKEFKIQAESYSFSTQEQKDLANGSVNNTRNQKIPNEINKSSPEVNVQNRLANQQLNANRVRSWTESDSIPTGFIAQQRSQSDSVTRLNVIMTPQPSAPLNEVVVAKAFGKKETDMKGRMAGIVIDTLEPAEGWTNFDDYIAGNLKVPDELKLKPISNGEVELSFDVNQKGEPVNITVLKSLCTKCDEEAVRLLKQGPKWKKKKNKKGKVTIRF